MLSPDIRPNFFVIASTATVVFSLGLMGMASGFELVATKNCQTRDIPGQLHEVNCGDAFLGQGTRLGNDAGASFSAEYVTVAGVKARLNEEDASQSGGQKHRWIDIKIGSEYSALELIDGTPNSPTRIRIYSDPTTITKEIVLK